MVRSFSQIFQAGVAIDNSIWHQSEGSRFGKSHQRAAQSRHNAKPPSDASAPLGGSSSTRHSPVPFAYLTMSLSALNGTALTTLRAGLALNICSCLVNGLIPLRAGTAGL